MPDKLNTVTDGGFKKFALDIFFPNRCPACGRVIGYDVRICGECLPKLEYLPDLPWQSFFPKEFGGDDAPQACTNLADGNFDGAVGLFKYDGAAKKALLSLKYHCALGFAEFAAEQIALKLDSEMFGRTDIVTAVPMNRIKQLYRGYNQAEEFARPLAALLGRPCDFSLLAHHFSLKSQHRLNAAERAAAAAKTYSPSPNAKSLKGKRVLICDDVLTTGSTLLNCSRLLKQLGAEKVYAAAICVAKKF